MKETVKCPKCGYETASELTVKCPRCGTIVTSCRGCSGNCLKCAEGSRK
ncbi:MAG: hypothetical protein ACOZCL_00215 [Bacillota bacterium]